MKAGRERECPSVAGMPERCGNARALRECPSVAGTPERYGYCRALQPPGNRHSRLRGNDGAGRPGCCAKIVRGLAFIALRGLRRRRNAHAVRRCRNFPPPGNRHSREGGNPVITAGSCSLYPSRRGGVSLPLAFMPLHLHQKWRSRQRYPVRQGTGRRGIIRAAQDPSPPGRETGNGNRNDAGFPPTRE